MSATLVSDRYQLCDRLGSGGVSSVFKATHPVLERTVAGEKPPRRPSRNAQVFPPVCPREPSDPPTGEMGVKLTDFGIARAAEQTRLTQVGSVVGTAAYLAPEQARGEEATPASDVYALGVVIYQLLTGRLPWEGTTLSELAIRRENERPLPPSSYDAAVPPTLSTAVLRSLEGDPALRYSTARRLSVALRAG